MRQNNMMLFYFITYVVLGGAWYEAQLSLCGFMSGFSGSDGGYNQWYDCSKSESLFLSSSIPDSDSCTTYDDCFLESFEEASDLCVGTYCQWVDGCYCHYIEDPFSATDGCD